MHITIKICLGAEILFSLIDSNRRAVLHLYPALGDHFQTISLSWLIFPSTPRFGYKLSFHLLLRCSTSSRHHKGSGKFNNSSKFFINSLDIGP